MFGELVIESMCFCLTCLFPVSLECIQVFLGSVFLPISLSPPLSAHFHAVVVVVVAIIIGDCSFYFSPKCMFSNDLCVTV